LNTRRKNLFFNDVLFEIACVSLARMEEMGTEALAMALHAGQFLNPVPWRRSADPIRRPVNTERSSRSLAASHHGEAGATRASSAGI
jgi:hypothetical protein